MDFRPPAARWRCSSSVAEDPTDLAPGPVARAATHRAVGLLLRLRCAASSSHGRVCACRRLSFGDVRLQSRCLRPQESRSYAVPGQHRFRTGCLRPRVSGRRSASPPTSSQPTRASAEERPARQPLHTTAGRATVDPAANGTGPTGRAAPARAAAHTAYETAAVTCLGQRGSAARRSARPRDDSGAEAEPPEEDHRLQEVVAVDARPPWSSGSGGRPGCHGRRTRPAPTPRWRRARHPGPVGMWAAGRARGLERPGMPGPAGDGEHRQSDDRERRHDVGRSGEGRGRRRRQRVARPPAATQHDRAPAASLLRSRHRAATRQPGSGSAAPTSGNSSTRAGREPPTPSPRAHPDRARRLDAAVQVPERHPGPQLRAPGRRGDGPDHLVVGRAVAGGRRPGVQRHARRRAARPRAAPPAPPRPTRRRATLEPRASIRATSSWPV